MPKAVIDATRKTTNSTAALAPSSETKSATTAPGANGARKKPPVSISPVPKTAAATSHQIHASTLLNLSSVQPRPGEVVGVEGPQVLQALADADQLDRDPQLAGDRQGDPALGRPVELDQHDAVDRDRLGEELGLAQPVLAGRRVDSEQRLMRGVGHLLGDHATDLGQLGHQL